MSWGDGRAYCESYGYDLLVVEDSGEWDWISATAPYSYAGMWWVGLYCALGTCTSTADFLWLDGTAGYVGWSGAAYDRDNDCAYVDTFMVTETVQGLWATADRCDNGLGVICEAE